MIILLAVGISAYAEEPQPSNLDKVYSALEMTQADKDMTAKLHDGTEGFQENAFYWMMKKIADLPPLDPKEIAGLDSPSYQNMLRSPDRYRFLPVRMNIYVYTVQELTREKYYLVDSPFWNSDKPIYRIHATNAASGEMRNREPLIIFSDRLPPNLPAKFEQAPKDTKEYKSGPAYEVIGIFFKYTEETDREGVKRKYPMLLAWQFTNQQSQAQDTVLTKVVASIGILVIVLFGGAYMFARRKVKAAKKPIDHKGLFQKKDDELNDDNDDNIDPLASIPPELAQAAKEYREEHGIIEEPRKG